MQNVIKQFTDTIADPRCSFLGNVTVGKDVSLRSVQELYHAVIFCLAAILVLSTVAAKSIRLQHENWAQLMTHRLSWLMEQKAISNYKSLDRC